jgi:hypothetical protein
VFVVMTPALVQLAHLLPGADYLHEQRPGIRKNSARARDSCDP